jgi:hypothetical protein
VREKKRENLSSVFWDIMLDSLVLPASHRFLAWLLFSPEDESDLFL